jgi:arylsulfatase A-like enzyme
MRYDFIRAHGNADMHTPNLDALIAGGVSFERCYANNPLCMPSRASFMTGCYPQQTQVMANGHELRPDFSPTIAQCFANGGYRTVQIGKLHLQCHEDTDLDPRPKHGYGFEVFQLSEEPGCYEDAYRTWLRGEHPDLVETFTVPRPMSNERHAESKTFHVLDAPWEASHSGWIATQACRYLGSWGLRQEPQFMHLGFYAPHPPLNPTREMFEPYEKVDPEIGRCIDQDWCDAGQADDQTLKDYKRHFYAMITGVDMAVGKLVDHLKKLGIYDNTLLVFGSDHGDACGDHGRTSKDNSYYEGIMRLPLVFQWPAGLGTQNRRVGSLVEMVDVMPTLLDLASLPIPPAVQGRSYAT